MASKTVDIALVAALFVSVGLNVFQYRELNDLRSNHPLRRGILMTEIVAQNLSGEATRIRLAGSQSTILYIFSPQCGWCTRNYQSVKALAERVQGRYRFVGLSLTDRGLRESLAANPLPFEIYANPSIEAVAAYGLAATPETIVVSTDGRVERAWRGAYAGSLKTQIRRYFGVDLPNIAIAGSG